jgi:two-component sensor histidine kinase
MIDGEESYSIIDIKEADSFLVEIKGEISIDFRLDNSKKSTLVFSDNGVGFPEDFDLRNTELLGLQLVNILTQQSRGTGKLDRTVLAKFTITFSVSKK